MCIRDSCAIYFREQGTRRTGARRRADAGGFDAAGSDAAGGNPGAVWDAEQGGGTTAENSGTVPARRGTERGLAAVVSVGGSDAAVCGGGTLAASGGGSG